MSSLRKLPIGVQDFEKLRTNNNIYVDKTMYINKLKQSDAPYFLSRPRRFGKSLFLSTLKAYFLGKEELFEGLAIADIEKEWIEYPVFYIDFQEDMITEYKAGDENPIPILYQSGYLTIKKYDKKYNEYTLGFPNDEVKYGFIKRLIPAYIRGRDMSSNFSVSHFVRDLEAGNVDGFMSRLQAFFSGIPYELNNKEEKHYQTVFYLLFKMMGQFVQAEQSSSIGRADAVVVMDDKVYIFEFKLTENASAEDALKQIDERKYAAQYAVDNKKIVKVGVEFSAEERTLSRWVQG